MEVPYIGSKISLISKSDIRYEGTLYSIDTKDSTISLAQVRSFGTENRLTSKPIPPREEIFEMIIFRATDIKDLIVDDPPNIPLGLTDPAIIQAHSGSSGLSRSNVQNTAYTASVPTAIGQRPQGNAYVAPSVAPVGVTSGPPSVPAFGSSGASTPTPIQNQQSRRSPVSDASGNVANVQNVVDDEKVHNVKAGIQNRWHNRGPNQPQFRRPQGPLQQRQNPQLPYRNQGRQVPFPGPPRRGPMFARAPPQQRPQFNQYNNRKPIPNKPKKPDGLKLDGDYDFEKANQEFQELENKLSKIKVSEKEEKKEVPKEKNEDKKSDEENQFYDKTKSFFDKISCEAIERSRGKVNRVDWRKERKINAETFGVMNNYRRNLGGFRGRGGGFRPNRTLRTGMGRGIAYSGGGDSRKNA